jgi:DNA-binding FadR family transcriptional regulator
MLSNYFDRMNVFGIWAREGGLKSQPHPSGLNETIRNFVEQYILNQGLKEGDTLPSESQFAQMLGVRRGSVHEAINALESLGIIEVRTGNRVYVREYNYDPIIEVLDYGIRFDTATLAELIQIRMWLETALVQDIANQVGPTEIANLDRQLNAWRKRLRDGESTIDLEECFHRTLYSIIGNRTLVRLLDVFWVALEQVPGIPYRNPEAVLDEHIAILDTLKEHNPVSAWQAVLRNLQHMQDSILASM